MPFRSGRHYLHIPGPTNVPDRILRAIDRPTIDHRGPEFSRLTREVLEGLMQVFQTSTPVCVFPGSGSGSWEAALVNTLSAGDRILMFDQGFFASGWRRMAERLGLRVDVVPGDWRCGANAEALGETLSEDRERHIQAVAVVHNETSGGVTSQIDQIRQVMDRYEHPALLLVDAISSLGSIEYCHDAWGVDVTISSSQKGLMLPPGLCSNALSDKALSASRTATLPRAYWDWEAMLSSNREGFFPYTPATNLLYGLREALTMLGEEGLENVFARHQRLAEATRQAVRAWDLEIFCRKPEEYSHSLTAVLVPEGSDSDRLMQVVLNRFDLSLGTGLGKLKGRVFRIGHLGSLNDLMLAGALCGIEMGLELTGIPFRAGGVTAALQFLQQEPPPPGSSKASPREQGE